MFIAADIGGTHARFGLFEADRLVRKATLATAEAARPSDLVAEFAAQDDFSGTTLAVAGAVVEQRAQGSNLPWEIDAAAMQDHLGKPVRLLNDLEAIARFVPVAGADQFEVLQAGAAIDGGPIGVIAPGTGIGQAMLFRDTDGSYRPQPSEAGHLDFAPNDTRQDGWLLHLRARHGHVSLERACSGSSLPAMYGYLSQVSDTEPDATTASAARGPDGAEAITRAALEGNCSVAVATLEMFCEILGAAAGDLALQIVATGGIVLAGGIPRRILPALREEPFLRAFRHKGRFSNLTERIPVSVLTNDSAGLHGAALAHREGGRDEAS